MEINVENFYVDIGIKGLTFNSTEWAIPENIHTQPRTASMFYPPLAFGNSKMRYPPHALRIP